MAVELIGDWFDVPDSSFFKDLMTIPRADLDSPWKDILRAYFPQAMQFFFPNTFALIDWDQSHEFLDKEFVQIDRDGELGGSILLWKKAKEIGLFRESLGESEQS